MRQALFLDRDGVIIEMRPEKGPKGIALHPEEVVLVPGIEKLLTAAKKKGWLLVVVSNQPDVAKGKASLADIEDTMREMERQLRKLGVVLDDIRYCLHHPDAKQVVKRAYLKECDCRKPQSGLITEAAQIHGVDLSRSYIIGDTSVDIEAGKRAGCKTILFNRNLQDRPRNAGEEIMVNTPDFVITDLEEAAELINQLDRGEFDQEKSL